MYRTMLLLFAVLISCATATANEPAASATATSQSAAAGEFEGRARAFVELLAKGRFDQAFARMDTAMQQAMPGAKLGEAWNGVQEACGPLQRVIAVRNRRIAGCEAVFVTCQFQRQRLDAKIVYNAAGQVAGLWFVPTAVQTAPSGVPAYVDIAAFEEKPVTVGAEGWPLPGTLTLPAHHPSSAPAAGAPAALYPAVVLVQGSGPQDRDETIGANKPFCDLAWGLACRGIVVLRYEKRTLEHSSRVGVQIKTITVREETVQDAVTAVHCLARVQGVDANRIFILGHSLGGTLAPRIARDAGGAAGIIIMAGITRPLADVIVEQSQYILANRNSPSSEDEMRLKMLKRQAKLAASPGLTIDTDADDLPMGIPAAYWIDLRGYDPVGTARLLKSPMLILQGGRDYQVGALDLAGWKNGLADQANVTIKEYPALNHLMIAGQGRSTPAEYELEGHVDEQVIRDVAQWVLAQKPG
jgi:uncharacterized protein